MEKFSKKIQEKFDEIQKSGKLFVSSLTGRQVWDLYLKGFGNDPKFRDPNSSVHNCNHCKNFVRRYGNIVGIDKNYDIVTMFDVEDLDEEYANSAKGIATMLKGARIKDVFFETLQELKSLPYESCKANQTTYRLGIDKNVKRYTKEEAELYGVVKPNELRVFRHLHLDIKAEFVDTRGKSQESIAADYRTAKEVFLRAMNEITLDTYKLVQDLVAQGSLLDGDTHLPKLNRMIPLKEEFNLILNEQREDNWAWVKSFKFSYAKFRNELMGVLCSELSQGEELNSAVMKWNKRVDPANYMKATAPITQTQINNAKQFVEDNGYVDSFNRRLATIEDIKASEIKHINSGDGKIESVSMFDNVKATKKSAHSRNKFDDVEEVPVEKFMKDILPNCNSVELYLENRFADNMVTMTTAATEDSKPIFKWDNNYSWTYKGNLAGKSMIKEAVKAKGGKVDGVLRFSIMWAEGDPSDNSDLDAWCRMPAGNLIGYSKKYHADSGGNLDIDITDPNRKNNKNIVENITFPTLSKMPDGAYKFWVNQYAARGSKGFSAEIEFNNEIFEFTYNKPVKWNVAVAEVTLKNGEFSIKPILPSSTISKEIYGLNSKEFHKVNLVCLSPNHWGENAVGNKHYFFMLDKCKADGKLRGFHSENLKSDVAEHRKVMEVLGATQTVEPEGKQLSGVGMNATVREEMVLRLKGNFNRMIKVKF